MTDATITKLLERSASDGPVRPDDEERHVVVDELSQAKTALYNLEQVRHYDELEVPGFEPYTVGAHLYGPAAAKRAVPHGVTLDRAIAVARLRVDDAQARYDAIEAREQAWVDHRMAEAQAQVAEQTEATA